MNTNRIYLSPPHMGGDELPLVQAAFASNWIAPIGPDIDAFEREICNHTGAAHALALSSGTAAIHIALKLCDVKPGNDVFCSSFTFAGSANPIVYEGATPVFIDSEEESWNMDPALLEEAILKRRAGGHTIAAIILVHLYGQPAQIDRIAAICEKNSIPLIEDAAESLGATYHGRHTGTFGRFGILSFNGNKIITTSGGGMLLSNDPLALERARFLATQARDPASHYEHSHIGYNYRLSNILAAIGRGQLKVLNDRITQKRYIFNYYYKKLGSIDGVNFMPELPYAIGNRWLTCITIDPTRIHTKPETIRLALEADNIESRPLWKPMQLQPVFSHAPFFGENISQRLFSQGLCLPSGTAMSDHDLDRIIEIICTQL